MRPVGIAAVVSAAMALAGCQSTATSGVVGAISGGTPTLVGGLAGNQIGRELSSSDRRTALNAEYRALEYGRAGATTPWSDSLTGRYGAVVPSASYRVNDMTCREYTHTIYIGGRSEAASGTACRSADGNWRTVS